MAERSDDDLSDLEHQSGCLVAISFSRCRPDFVSLVVDHSQKVAWPICRSNLLSSDAFPVARLFQSLLFHVESRSGSSRRDIPRRSFSILGNDRGHCSLLSWSKMDRWAATSRSSVSRLPCCRGVASILGEYDLGAEPHIPRRGNMFPRGRGEESKLPDGAQQPPNRAVAKPPVTRTHR